MKQASDSMNNLYEKSEQQQNDFAVNTSSHNQTVESDSIIDVSHDQTLKYQQQQWDIKPDPYL